MSERGRVAEMDIQRLFPSSWDDEQKQVLINALFLEEWLASDGSDRVR